MKASLAPFYKGFWLILGLFLTTGNLIGQTGSDIDFYLGRWALDLPNGAGWLEIRQEEGYLDGDIMWYGGSVVPVSNVFIHGDKLIVARTRNEKIGQGETKKNRPVTAWIELKAKGKQLAGTLFNPVKSGLSVQEVHFFANRIPPLPAPPNLSKMEYGKPVKLFNGKDLSGWTLTNEHVVSGWKVKKGALMNDPVQKKGKAHIHYGNLKTTAEYEDFNLKLEVKYPKGSNSGIYLRGIYEVQVSDSYGRMSDKHSMGSVFGRIKPTKSVDKEPGEWQKMDITLCKRHVTVILNGEKIIDNQPLHGVTGGALTANEFLPGPIYLQGDHGEVLFRKMVLTPIE